MNVATVGDRAPGQSEDGADEVLDQARGLMRLGAMAAAVQAVDGILDSQPEHAEALYIRAAALRYLERFEEAENTLGRLHQAAPEHARARQESGHLFRATGRFDRALAAYRQAVTLNPALVASWKALGVLEDRHGDSAAAERARRQQQRLESLPRELVTVTSLLHEGRLYRAERLCRQFLRRHPDHVEGMRLLAVLGMRLGVLDDAEFLLQSALEFEPDNAFVHFDYVTVLQRRQKYAEALEQARRLRERQPDNPSFETAYANACMAMGRYDDALATYDRVLGQVPDDAGVHLQRGHALKTMGGSDEAVAAYHAARDSRPGFGDAWWSLANLKTYRFDDSELERMAEREAAPETPLVDRYHLCFALGKGWEDRAAYETSFRYYRSGNELKRSETRYDPDRMAAEMAQQRRAVTADWVAERGGQGDPSPDPIFIIGLPRAGSTLIEQILASHSEVEGTFELPHILAMAHRLGGRRRVDESSRYPQVLRELDGAELRQLGQRYLADAAVHRGSAPFFIDKMPNNFIHLGLIHLALPNARIIDARREPMACCFSGFKQLFAEGQEFSYRLADIGRYYRDYERLMAHWETVLPERILRVRYEDVVADLETQVRRLLDFLGLAFEPTCLEFHRTERSVRTASSEQVRRPIFTSGLNYWRHYEPWLGPLREALGGNGDQSSVAGASASSEMMKR